MNDGLEESVVEVPKGRRFAGCFLQVSGAVLLLFPGVWMPWIVFWLVMFLVNGETLEEVFGVALAIVIASVVVVVGALMRTAGQLMRGVLGFRSSKALVHWAVCTAGKTLGIVWTLGLLGGVLGGPVHGSLVACVVCLILSFVILWVAGRLDEWRSRFVQRGGARRPLTASGPPDFG